MFTPATPILLMNLTIENVIIKYPNYVKLYVKMESCKLITYFIQNHRLILPHLHFGNHLYKLYESIKIFKVTQLAACKTYYRYTI